MKKLRLGLLVLSNSWGGAEESIYNMAKNIDKKEFAVSLLVNEFLCDRYKDIRSVSVVNLGRLESNKKIQKVYTLIKIRSRLFESVKKYRIEIIHARLENSLILLGTMLNKPSVPLVFTLCGDEKNKTKIKVITNGVDINKFRPLKLRRFNKSILFVGRYVEGKGIEDLLKVARQLKNYKFIFAGKGPLVSLLKLENTKDIGFQRRESLIKLYSQVTLCTFPSYSEGMPMVGLEAMACGTPVVASYVGFGEYIDNRVDGLIIEPGNIIQLKRAILKLMENSNLRKRLGKNARKKALKYDIKRVVLKYQDLYREVAK